MKKKLLVCFGTRPDAIKLAPVILEAKKRKLEVVVLTTGQHQEMLVPFLEFFEIVPNHALSVLKPNQHLADLTASILTEASKIIRLEKPDLVFVQGDTTTTMASALAAFYEKISVAHVEAGLRTYDRYSPFPEEMNRKIVGQISEFHFSPTPDSKQNLEKEGVNKNVFVTGNTGIDAMRIALSKLNLTPETNKSILVTCHRRENHGEPLLRICAAIAELAQKFSDYVIEFPVHLNPNVKTVVHENLKKFANVRLKEPLGYLDFITQMSRASVIITDSGGVQEEAPYLKKPIFVLRESTERPEGVKAGVAELVGSNQKKIVERVSLALTDADYRKKFEVAVNPYGDGFAAQRIFESL